MIAAIRVTCSRLQGPRCLVATPFAPLRDAASLVGLFFDLRLRNSALGAERLLSSSPSCDPEFTRSWRRGCRPPLPIWLLPMDTHITTAAAVTVDLVMDMCRRLYL